MLTDVEKEESAPLTVAGCGRRSRGLGGLPARKVMNIWRHGIDTARITEILTDPVTLDLVQRQPIMQIAYVAADGSPRAVPLGYLLRDGKFVFFTIPSSDKVAALNHDPRIAITIDDYPPPCCLLVRGIAMLREEDGVPEEYLEASFRTMPEDQHAGFGEQVRALYDSMVRIEVTPTWVRLNDFQRTAPRAVERLVQAKHGSWTPRSSLGSTRLQPLEAYWGDFPTTVGESSPLPRRRRDLVTNQVDGLHQASADDADTGIHVRKRAPVTQLWRFARAVRGRSPLAVRRAAHHR